MTQETDIRNIEALARRIKPASFEELADAMGDEWSESWQEQIMDEVPGIADFIEAQRASKMAEIYLKKGDIEKVKMWKRLELVSISNYMQFFDPVPAFELAAPPEQNDESDNHVDESDNDGSEPRNEPEMIETPKKTDKKLEATKIKKMKMPEIKIAVAPEMIESEVMRSCVLGMTGETYCGRPVVIVQLKQGMFGTNSKAKTIKATLHKGILNQCAVRAGGATPYWAALDAMSELKTGFSKEQVVEKAAAIIGGKDADKACSIAFDVLKTHYSHPKKKDCAMSHVVDTDTDGKMSIRGRSPEETQAHFDAMRKRSDASTSKKQDNPPEIGSSEGEPVTVIVGKNG